MNKETFCPNCGIGLNNYEKMVGYCQNCETGFPKETAVNFNDRCVCGHLHYSHKPIGDDYSSGHCTIGECRCKHFVHDKNKEIDFDEDCIDAETQQEKKIINWLENLPVPEGGGLLPRLAEKDKALSEFYDLQDPFRRGFILAEDIVKRWCEENYPMGKKGKPVTSYGGYEETLKAALNNAIEHQEQEQREEYNRGREDAFKYALEMLQKHVQAENGNNSYFKTENF